MLKKSNRLSGAWFWMLLYTYAVLLWGTFVRTSRSGDGCGKNWPHCEGGYWADFDNIAQAIEFLHRASTGIYGLIALGLVVWTLKKKPGRTSIGLCLGFLLFLLLEALVGRVLVVEGYVVDDPRMMRLLWMGLHFLNTLTLTTFVVVLWQWTKTAATSLSPKQMATAMVQSSWLWAFLTVSIVGITASMYDSTVVLGGKEAHLLAQWVWWTRNAHPFIAIGFALSIFYHCLWNPSGFFQPIYRQWMLTLVGLNVLAGASNLLWHDQPWTQVVHVLLAHLLWLVIVLSVFAKKRSQLASKG